MRHAKIPASLCVYDFEDVQGLDHGRRRGSRREWLGWLRVRPRSL